MTVLTSAFRLTLVAAGVCLLAGAFTPLAAQPDSGGPLPGNTATAVPLDGGVSLLIAAGAAYGLKRFRGAKRDRAS